MFEAGKSYDTAAGDTALPHDLDLWSSTLIMYCKHVSTFSILQLYIVDLIDWLSKV